MIRPKEKIILENFTVEATAIGNGKARLSGWLNADCFKGGCEQFFDDTFQGLIVRMIMECREKEIVDCPAMEALDALGWLVVAGVEARAKLEKEKDEAREDNRTFREGDSRS